MAALTENPTWALDLEYGKLLSQSSFTENPELYRDFAQANRQALGDRVECNVWEWNEGILRKHLNNDLYSQRLLGVDSVRKYVIQQSDDLNPIDTRAVRIMLVILDDCQRLY
jgi:hypothetical protein